jgi:hypothetical protein
MGPHLANFLMAEKNTSIDKDRATRVTEMSANTASTATLSAMTGPDQRRPSPVLPEVIQVSDIMAACAALGLPAPADGMTSAELELLPGRIVTIVEGEGTPTDFCYVCTNHLTQARQQLEETFGVAEWTPDSIDPKTFRLRGALLRGGGLIIDAVSCPNADRAGIPCSPDCSPFLSFA